MSTVRHRRMGRTAVTLQVRRPAFSLLAMLSWNEATLGPEVLRPEWLYFRARYVLTQAFNLSCIHL